MNIAEECILHWDAMGLSKDWKIKRLADLASMFEKRLAELDPNYKAYPYGLIYLDRLKGEATSLNETP